MSSTMPTPLHDLPETHVSAPRDDLILEDHSMSLSRSESLNSVWSSAEVPLFFDGSKGGDATGLPSSSLPSHARSSTAGSSASSAGPGWEARPSISSAAIPRRRDSRSASSHFVNPWASNVRSIPNGPESPRLSFASSASSSAARAAVAELTADGNTHGDQLSKQSMIRYPTDASATSSHRGSLGSARGFKLKKPATLQVTPIAFSTPLRHTPSNSTPTNPLSAGDASTLAPSSCTSPARSQDTMSIDLRTPMTEKSLQSRPSRQSQVAGTIDAVQSGKRPDVSNIDRQHGSLYSRAEKFFKTDYTMLPTSSGGGQEYYLSTDERRERPREPSIQEVGDATGSYHREYTRGTEAESGGQQAHGSAFAIEDWGAGQASSMTEERPSTSAAPQRQYQGSLPSVQYSPSSARFPSQPRGSSFTSTAKNRNLYPPRGSSFVGRSEQAGANTILENGRHSSLSTQTYDYGKASPRSPLRPKHSPLNFVQQGSPESPKASRALPREDQSFKTRLRALSVPKLQASWHAPDDAVAATRKASLFVADADQLGPRGSSRGSISPALRLLQLRNDARSELSLDEVPTSPSALGLTRQSQVGRLGSVLSRSSSQKSRKGSVISLSQTQGTSKRLIRSPSRPKTKGDWSSYLSEGLTLYVDQGGTREVALRMPYLSYDPFGRLDSLATGAGAGGGSPPSITKRGSSRPTSAGKGAQPAEDEVGLLEFARSELSGPLGAAYFSPIDTAPILRHLGIGEDTKADLLTRQAALSVEVNGLHQVSGLERSGKVGWRFSYEISSIYRGEEVPERVLRPVSFVCSATLLDPERARKGRFLKMVKKGVATNISSNLVQGPEGSERLTSMPGTPVGEGRGSLRKDSLSVPDGQIAFDYRGYDRQSESVDYGRDEVSFTRGHEYRLASLPSPLPSPGRQSDATRTPASHAYPAGVLPFQLKSSRKVVTPPRTSSAAMSPSSSREHDLNDLLLPLSLESHPASLVRSLDSDEAIVPQGRASQTASEEIKMAYLRSSLQREEAAAAAAAAAAINIAGSLGRRNDSGSNPTHLNGTANTTGSVNSGSSGTWPRFRSRRGESPSSPSSTRGSPLHQHFEARDIAMRRMGAASPTFGKSQSQSQSVSRNALRKALSSKALPRTPREERSFVAGDADEDSPEVSSSAGAADGSRGSVAAATRDAEKRNGGGGATMLDLGLV